MYPTLLRDRPYPVALVRRGDVRDPDELRDVLRSWGAVARVRVKTQTPEYPLRRNDRTIYPIGEFTTTLAGPDLTPLLEANEIVRVYDCAVYRMGEPFRASMDALLSERERARAAGDDDGQTFAKLLANSLAGKLAQRSGKWVRVPDRDCRGRWGESREVSYRTGEAVRWRHLAGLAWRYDASAEHRGPHSAAYAYLTAYGRQMMAAVRASCPPKSVVSQDTDGVWVLNSAVDSLRRTGILAGEGPGRLRKVGSARSARFYGPRHYQVDGSWVLSGFAEAVVDTDSLTVLYTSRAPLFASLPYGPPDHVLTRVYRSGLPARDDSGRLREDGWIDPPHILPGRSLEE